MTMTSWSPASLPGLVSMALFSVQFIPVISLIPCQMWNRPLFLDTSSCGVPKALFSVLSFTQLPYRIFLFPKSSPVCRWHSAVPFLHSDSLQLQYRSPSKVSQLEFSPGWLELPDNIFNWVNDFLHCTRYAGYSSSVADITASIIQGSSLGPASHSIMAADLHPDTNGNELLSSPTTRT